jgi:hypothetical protein
MRQTRLRSYTLERGLVLYELGQQAAGLEKLRQARRRDRSITRIKDLQYKHFWGPRAVAALEAMLAQS